MRRLLFAALVAAIPMAGLAQQQPDRTAAVSEDLTFFGVTTDHLLAIGLGVVGGAVGLHVLLGGGSATVAGALAGALVGNWWYEQKMHGGPLPDRTHFTPHMRMIWCGGIGQSEISRFCDMRLVGVLRG